MTRDAPVDSPVAGPLEGVRVVVTRPRSQAAGLVTALEAEGATVIPLPTIDTVDPPSWADLDLAIRKLSEGLFGWVIFTSVNAVERFFARLEVSGLDARAFARSRIATVGAATTAALRHHGLRADLVPETFTGADLARALGRGPGRVLIPRSAHAPREMIDILGSSGWIPEVVHAYVTVPARGDSPEAAAVRSGAFDVVTFTSGSSARAFAGIVAPPRSLGLALGDEPTRKVVCIGPRTAEVAINEGFRVDAVADDHTAGGLLEAITELVSSSIWDGDDV
jgi:uroporphyrinogen-III synthase